MEEMSDPVFLSVACCLQLFALDFTLFLGDEVLSSHTLIVNLPNGVMWLNTQTQLLYLSTLFLSFCFTMPCKAYEPHEQPIPFKSRN